MNTSLLVQLRQAINCALILSVLFLSTGCSGFLPVSSSMEDASTLGRTGVEASGHLSTYSKSIDGKSDESNRNAGLRLASGVSDKVDLAFRYERLTLPAKGLFEEGAGINYLGLGQKLSLVENRSALRLRENVYFTEADIFDYSLGLGYIYSYFFAEDMVDLSANVGYDYFFDDKDHLGSLNLGLGFRPGKGVVLLRLEYGFLKDMENYDDRRGNHLSVGLIYSQKR